MLSPFHAQRWEAEEALGTFWQQRCSEHSFPRGSVAISGSELQPRSGCCDPCTKPRRAVHAERFAEVFLGSWPPLTAFCPLPTAAPQSLPLSFAAETPIEEFTPTPAFPALQYLESVDVEGVAWRAGLRTGDFLIEVSPLGWGLTALTAAPCSAAVPYRALW